MKISVVNTSLRTDFSAQKTGVKNTENTTAVSFKGGNDSTKISIAILGASALVGLLIYLALAPQGKKAASKTTDTFQLQSSTFGQDSNKNVTINRPSSK